MGTFQNEEVYGYLSGFLDSGFCHKALNPETKEIIAVSFSKEITPVSKIKVINKHMIVFN